jgi:DNA-binding XRE family transcriptional regulator
MRPGFSGTLIERSPVDYLIPQVSVYMPNALITSDQIRAARAMLQWSAADLARTSGVGIATIKRMEVQAGVPHGQVRILEAVALALEASGIEFIGSPDDGPGVRFRKPTA